MSGILDKPYYFNRNSANRIKVISVISLGFFLFLVLFSPFEFNNIATGSKVYYFLGFGLFTLVILGIDLLILPKLFNNDFLNNKWKIKHEVLWNFWILISLAGGYYGFICITKVLPVNYETIVNLLLLALLPVVVLITVNQDVALRKYLKLIPERNGDQKTKETDHQKKIILHSFISENIKESLEINLQDLLFFSSTGNYINVVWFEENNLRKKLLRGTIMENLKPLENYDFIVRVHRSYVVNVKMLVSVSGNSKTGFKLRVRNYSEEIPVSRKYISNVKHLYSRQKNLF